MGTSNDEMMGGVEYVYMGQGEGLAIAGGGYGSDCGCYGLLLVFVRWAEVKIVPKTARGSKCGAGFSRLGGVLTVLVFWGTRFRVTSVLLKKSFCPLGGLLAFPQYTIIVIYIYYY